MNESKHRGFLERQDAPLAQAGDLAARIAAAVPHASPDDVPILTAAAGKRWWGRLTSAEQDAVLRAEALREHNANT